MNRVLTEKNEAFIKANYRKISSYDIGEKLNVPRGTVASALKRMGLKITAKLKEKFRMDAIQKRAAEPRPEDKVIKRWYLKLPVNALAIKIGRSEQFVKTSLKRQGLKIPKKLIEQRKKDSRIKPGNVPPNKGLKQTDYMSKAAIKRTMATRFKTGGLPHNTHFDGAITLRHEHPERKGSKPHYHIRISKGKWKELQIHNWEKINGPVPKGFILTCQDGNTLNCEPDNWKLMSKADNAKRNAGHKNLPDSYVAWTIAGRNHKDLVPEILKKPEIIETKRAILTLKKAIRSKQNSLTQ
jgi:hypothetical protein